MAQQAKAFIAGSVDLSLILSCWKENQLLLVVLRPPCIHTHTHICCTKEDGDMNTAPTKETQDRGNDRCF